MALNASYYDHFPSALCHCWLGVMKGNEFVKTCYSSPQVFCL